MTTIPKGGMCKVCRHIVSDCSGLAFSSMRVIKIYSDGTKAVKCTKWEKK